MNTVINNPALPVIATIHDVAAAANLSVNSARMCMRKDGGKMGRATVQRVRQIANEMGYVPQTGYQCAAMKRHQKAIDQVDSVIPTLRHSDTPVTISDLAKTLGISVPSVKRAYGSKEKRNEKLAEKIRLAGQIMGYIPGRSKPRILPAQKPAKWYWGGNYHSREEEVQRMRELRAQGYSNADIAKKICRSYQTVLHNIGPQDRALTLQNKRLAHHAAAQKNAARKQYVLNRPILEYNAKVEEHNKLKAKVVQMEAELLPQAPAIEKAAQIKIDFPLVNLSTVKPTALQ